MASFHGTDIATGQLHATSAPSMPMPLVAGLVGTEMVNARRAFKQRCYLDHDSLTKPSSHNERLLSQDTLCCVQANTSLGTVPATLRAS